MADDAPDVPSPDASSDASPLDPAECRACRGSGTVISNLGVEASTVACPWCDGGGRFLPEHDAQAHFRSGEPSTERPEPVDVD